MNERDDPASPTGADGQDPWFRARHAMTRAHADASLTGLPAALQRICRAATESLSLLGAVVQVIADSHDSVVLASSDDVSRRLGEMSLEVGEGPSVEAFAVARPVLAPDLVGSGQSRWPGYVTVVSDAGVRAAYALPLHVGAVRLGVIELYDARSRVLAPAELSLALVFSEAATHLLLDPPDGGSSVTLLDDPDVAAMGRRIEIHQAQGMVTVDLGIDLAAALALMRAHAFSRGLPLLELARLILGGEQIRVTDEG